MVKRTNEGGRLNVNNSHRSLATCCCWLRVEVGYFEDAGLLAFVLRVGDKSGVPRCFLSFAPALSPATKPLSPQSLDCPEWVLFWDRVMLDIGTS